MNDLARLLVILGPTASGKSALGIELAQQLGGEILVCDSTQVYRHFDIGTAKVPPPSSTEFRITSSILSNLRKFLRPENIAAAPSMFWKMFAGAVSFPSSPQAPASTFARFWKDSPMLQTRSEELRDRLRAKVQARGPEHLHRLLNRLDREAAARIAPRDTQKIIRAIEMRILAGKAVGEIHRSGRSGLAGHTVTKIGLSPPRDRLYARIDARVNAMIAAGWVDEVRRLVEMGVPADAKPFQFIGYSDLRDQIASGRVAR